MKSIQTPNAPAAVGPYSQAIVDRDIIFCSGQIGLTPSGELQEGLEAQTRQVLDNLKSVLEEAGSDISSVVKTTVYLANINDYPKVNAIYAECFSESKPARATIQVAGIPKGALVEIDAIAVKNK